MSESFPLFIKRALQRTGWHENEILIYSILLNKGPLGLKDISSEVNTPISTTQYVIKKLRAKKMIGKRIVDNNPVYTAAESEKLIQWVSDYKNEFEHYLKSVKDFVEQLEPKADKFIPQVKFYRKSTGVKNSYRDILSMCKSNEIYSMFSAPEAVKEDFKEFIFKEFIPGRMKRGIKNKNIALDCPMSVEYSRHSDKYFNETQRLPNKTVFNSAAHTTEINVFDNCVHCMTFAEDEAFATLIEDRGLSSILKMVFTHTWKSNEIFMFFEGRREVKESYEIFLERVVTKPIYSFQSCLSKDLVAYKNIIQKKGDFEVKDGFNFSHGFSGEINLSSPFIHFVQDSKIATYSILLKDCFLVEIIEMLLIRGAHEWGNVFK